MECNDVKLHLDDYFGGKLSGELKDNVQAHLDECKDCENEYKLLNNFLLQAKYLQTGIKTPDEIAEGISDQLIKLSSGKGDGEKVFDKAQLKKLKKAMRLELSKEDKEESRAKVKLKKTKAAKSYSFRNFFWILFSLVLFVGGYVLYDFSKFNAPWEIRADNGGYSINGIQTDVTAMKDGDILMTDIDSDVRINIPNIGLANLPGNTKLTLVKAKDGENIIELQEGELHVKTRVFQPGLSLLTDLVSITDLGSEFTLLIESKKRNKIELLNGFVEINFNGEEIKLSMEHVCVIDKENGIGIPYHFEATEEFISALEEFQFLNGGAAALNKILSEATEYDALSLWYLLQITESNDRRRVVEKLVDYYPLTYEITEDGILSLDPAMLTHYWNELEWQL